MVAEDPDPRLARSRARLLDATQRLLHTGGVAAVTVEAVTKTAKVARATLYRHFSSSSSLITTALANLIPPMPVPPETGTLRDRLCEIVAYTDTMISEVPFTLTALSWAGLGPRLGDITIGDEPEMATLRRRLMETYSAPYNAVLSSESAKAEIGEVDFKLAFVQLVGPLVLTRLLTLSPLDEAQIRELVDDFLAAKRSTSDQ